MLSILIADDEASTLNGISGILRRYPKEFRIAAAVPSAEAALAFLREHGDVDAVITDIRMPGMDGVELVGALAADYPAVRAVVLSGYADFQYVRSCLTGGAVDYLLKPCRYQVLLGILRKIADEKSARQDCAKRESLERAVRDLILSGEARVPPELGRAGAYLLCFRAAQRYAEFSAHIGAYIERRLAPLRAQCLSIDLDPDVLVVLDGALGEQAAADFRAELYEHCRNRETLSAMSFSDVVRSEELVVHARSCRQLCEFAEYNAINRPIALSERGALFLDAANIPLAGYLSQPKLLALLQVGSGAELSREFAELTAPLLEIPGYRDPAKLKKGVRGMLLQLDAMLPARPDPGAESMVSVDEYYLDQIRQGRSVKDLLLVIEKYLLHIRATAASQPSYPKCIHVAIRYIKSHYMEDIRLSDISKEVYLNEWYFSSLFKKHVGTGFKEYLLDVRIDAAKQLLQHGDLKIGQIAEMVGFSDAAHFATTFKSATGQAPTEYRKSSPLGGL